MGAISFTPRPPKTFRYSDNRRKHLTSRGFDIGLTFPVGNLQQQCRTKTKTQFFVADDAAVYLGAIIEYLCAEILEQAGSLNTSEMVPPASNTIRPTHLQRVFQEDAELRQLLNNLIPKSQLHKMKHYTPEQDLCEAFQSLSVERGRK